MARHPLQRLSSPSRSLSAALHIGGLVSFASSFRFLFMWPTPIDEQFGWHFQFLTIVGLGLSAVTFTLGLLADLTLSPQLFAAKNTLAVCAAPLEVLISILYWGICAIDKSLVFPPDMALPVNADFGFHLAPAAVLSLDLLLLSPPWTIRAYSALGLSLMFAFLYWFWIEWCFSKNQTYPYPIFELLNPPLRALLFTFSACLMTGSTIMLKWLYGRINGLEHMQREAHQPLKRVD
jgi:hypothetical protein